MEPTETARSSSASSLCLARQASHGPIAEGVAIEGAQAGTDIEAGVGPIAAEVAIEDGVVGAAAVV